MGRSRIHVSLLLGLVLAPGSTACVKTYDLVVDNRTMTSLTMRVYSIADDGRFRQVPDRIFELPPNREFHIDHAIAATGHGDRRMFEFRRPDEQLVDSYVVTYAELERTGGRLTVPRALASILRGTPPEPGYVDSGPHEQIQYIPLFPADSGPGGK